MVEGEFGLRFGNRGWKLDGDGPAGFHLPPDDYRDVSELMGPVDRALRSLGLELLTLTMDGTTCAHVTFKKQGGCE